MKKTLLALATTLTLGASAFFITSCGEDKCKDVECGAHGTCNEGVCDCAAGYEQDTNGRCDVLINQKFVGIFEQKDSPVTTDDEAYCNETYKTTITADATNPSKLKISNFAGSGTKTIISATVSTTNTSIYTIDAGQEVNVEVKDDKGNIDIITFVPSGQGTLSSDKNTLTTKYEFAFNGTRFFGCTSSGKRQ